MVNFQLKTLGGTAPHQIIERNFQWIFPIHHDLIFKIGDIIIDTYISRSLEKIKALKKTKPIIPGILGLQSINFSFPTKNPYFSGGSEHLLVLGKNIGRPFPLSYGTP